MKRNEKDMEGSGREKWNGNGKEWKGHEGDLKKWAIPCLIIQAAFCFVHIILNRHETLRYICSYFGLSSISCDRKWTETKRNGKGIKRKWNLNAMEMKRNERDMA